MSERPATPWARLVGWILLLGSALLWVFITVCFVGTWDHVAVVTTFPYWAWAFLGVLCAMLAGWLMRPLLRWPWAMLGLWLLATAYSSDNLLPVLRGLIHGSHPVMPAPTNTLRVVTLNCASSADAAGEVMKFHPDILLLQESPVSNKLAQLAREWFGERASFIIGMDCAIVSHYPLQPVEERLPIHYTRGVLSISTNRRILITSLRFTPPIGRMDLWNPAAWRGYLDDRRLRSRQLQSVLEAKSVGRADLEIMGGDFNAPSSDGIYRMLRRYQDSHREAGRRWGHTAINTLPLFRPDQIWTKGLMPKASFAFETKHSDHRMVVMDLGLPDANEKSRAH